MAHSMDRVIEATCAVFNISKETLLSDTRLPGIVYPRFLACWIGRHRLNLTNEVIGDVMCRDLSTVSHAIRRVESLLEQTGDTQRDIFRIFTQMDKPLLTLQLVTDALRITRPSVRPFVLQDAVIATGGTWSEPQLGYGDHEYAIKLFGISATASDDVELCLNWLRCADRVLAAETQMEKVS